MSELLDLLDVGPMIALAIACVLMVSVLVVVLLQARRISRLERRLSERGDAADDAPLRRIAELQARQEASESVSSSASALRPALAVVAGVVVLVLAIGGVWLFLTGGNDGSAAPGSDAAATSTKADGDAPAATTNPIAATTVPATIPPLADTSQYTVMVYNASGVVGAAGDGVAPRLTTEGFNVLKPENYPTNESDLARSVVMYNGEKNRTAAWNVADVLNVKRTPPLEGLTVDQIGGADVVVVVGTDLAQSVVSTATP